MFKSCEDYKYEKGCKFREQYQEALRFKTRNNANEMVEQIYRSILNCSIKRSTQILVD